MVLRILDFSISRFLDFRVVFSGFADSEILSFCLFVTPQRHTVATATATAQHTATPPHRHRHRHHHHQSVLDNLCRISVCEYMKCSLASMERHGMRWSIALQLSFGAAWYRFIHSFIHPSIHPSWVDGRPIDRVAVLLTASLATGQIPGRRSNLFPK